MNVDETAALTEQMLRSGSTLPWSSRLPPKVDKHSTGGIGDKSSIVLAPLLASCGLQVPMISGRGLGATGGTLDKLESIPGFRTNLSTPELCDVVERIGCVITGATSDLVPADRMLYALRDVTATVASIPLITASIMSKKLAENLDALVLDVKYGSGAFMKSLDDARALARSLVDTGKRMGVKTTALITCMNQPNGRLAGNAVEIDECVQLLAGAGPADLREKILALATELLLMTGVDESSDAARTRLTTELDSGRAMEKLREMVAAQGGDLDATRHVAPATDIESDRAGTVAAIDTELLGLAIIAIGGGRRVMGDKIDHSVGIEMLVRVGDTVTRGQPLLRVFAQPDAARQVRPSLLGTFTIVDRLVEPLTLIVDRIA